MSINVVATPGSLAQCVANAGTQMVACNRNCPGIHLDKANGVYPRCLFLEWPSQRTGSSSTGQSREGQTVIPIISSDDLPHSASSKDGAIVIGLNPGKSNDAERKWLKGQYAKKNQAEYQHTVEYWAKHSAFTHKYYTSTRKLIRAAGLTGPILWTELAKCENEKNQTNPLPAQTYRACVHNYLENELKCVPADWPVFALGRIAYDAACFLLTNRRVLGVPHPTGSHGNFRNLFDSNGNLESGKNGQNGPRKTANDVLSSNLTSPEAEWLK